MLLNTVIFILQETLEAALVISILLAINYLFSITTRWLSYSIGFGLIGAFTYAFNMKAVSQWFSYVGQEVVNATLQIAIVVLIGIYTFIIFSYKRLPETALETPSSRTFYFIITGSIVALGIVREGSEILLYVSGFFLQSDGLSTVTVGGSIGFGIGLSIGIILYYALVNMAEQWKLIFPVILLAVFCGNMAAQSALHLTQADWLPYTPVLWNTSTLIAEGSLTGRLLYALFGYEATPSYLQAASYLFGVTLVIFIAYIDRFLSPFKAAAKNSPLKRWKP